MTETEQLNRRAAMGKFAAWSAAAALPLGSDLLGAETDAPTTGLGLVIYDCRFRRMRLRRQDPKTDLYEPLRFLDHCRLLGAGGMQVRLGVLDATGVRRLREAAERQPFFIDAIVSPPENKIDLPRFEAEIRTARQVGVQAARTVIMPGRRYERFSSLPEFREFAAKGKRMLELAAPVAEKYGVPLAVENHKDQRDDERVALFEHISSELVGACVDTGNSLALLEDPIETVRALARWAKTVHLKDQAVQPYEDGFLLGDIPLGQGCLDLPQMVQILRQAQPEIRFALELITRDPLRVPCLTEKYWATMPNVPGQALARTLRMVREHRADRLQMVGDRSLNDQVALEDANVRASLRYAHETLKI